MPFDVPKSWGWVTLEEYANKITDFVASGSFASLRENVKYYDTANYAILVRTKDFQTDFKGNLVYTDYHGYEFLENSRLFGGEIILPNIGASIGKSFIVPHLKEPMTLAPNSILIRTRKNIETSWLLAFFRSKTGVDTLHNISSSTAQGKFNKTDLKKVLIPLPPLSEQHRIVAEIEKWFAMIDKIEAGQKDLVTLIEQAKSKILDLAIHGKLVPQDPNNEPAEALLRRINPQWQPCDTSHYPFTLPRNWQWVHIGDVVHAMRKAQPSGATFKYIDIDSVDNKINKCTPKIVDTSRAPSRASRYTQKGDTVFSMVRPYLKNIALIEEDCCIASTGFFVCSPKDMLDIKYCFYLMLSNYVVDGLNCYMKGDNSPSINTNNVEEYLVPLPPLSEQKRIVFKMENLLSTLELMTKAIDL